MIEEPQRGLGAFWQRHDARLIVAMVVFFVLITLLIIGTTVGHLGSALSGISQNMIDLILFRAL